MCTKAQLNEITDKITASAKETLGDKLRNVILYGSYARGDYNEDSDVDIMVLADIENEDAFTLGRPIRRVAGKIELENDMFISVQLKNRDFFNEWKETLPFYRNVINDGIILYEKQLI